MLYRLREVKRVYNGRTVLDVADLDLESGQVYTLIGPNGAGKTTLLKILAFLDRPSSGTVYFQDSEVPFVEKRLHGVRRRVVLLDQNPIMFTGSVWKNVDFGLKLRKVAKRDRQRRVGQALEMVGMEGFADYHAPGLSGGETKRVALARALVLQPEVLLCDEPTANVDNENQEIILKIIKKINTEQQCSVIFSTHYFSQAQQLADHTLILQHGALSEIASDNSYRATIVDRHKDGIICQLTGRLSLKLPVQSLQDHGEVVKIHIDPAGILLNPEEGKIADGNMAGGHVTMLSQDSGRVRLTVDIGVNMVATLSVDRYKMLRPGIGDKVQLFIPNGAVRFGKVDFPR